MRTRKNAFPFFETLPPSYMYCSSCTVAHYLTLPQSRFNLIVMHATVRSQRSAAPEREAQMYSLARGKCTAFSRLATNVQPRDSSACLPIRLHASNATVCTVSRRVPTLRIRLSELSLMSVSSELDSSRSTSDDLNPGICLL